MNSLHTTALQVEGMTCGSCVRHVESALRALPGVTSVDVRLRDRLALVRHDPTSAPVPALLSALSAEGYPAELEPESGG